VAASHTIAASFAADTYTITATAGTGGSISPSGAVAVNCGGTQGFTITPNACNHIVDVLVDGVSVGAVTSYTFTNVAASHTIAASFAADTYTIMASASNGGTISPSGSVSVPCSGNQAFIISPNGGHTIQDVLVDGVSVGAVSTYTFTNVGANHSIQASFRNRGKGGAATAEFTEAVSVGPVQARVDGGSLSIGKTIDVTWTTSGDANANGNTSTNPSVACVDLLLSRAGAEGPFETIGTCLPNNGVTSWAVSGPSTDHAVFKVVVHGASSDSDEALSESELHIVDMAPPATAAVEAAEFALPAIAPNPSRGKVPVSFVVPHDAGVRVTVLDVKGRHVATLLQGNVTAGRHQITWNGNTERGPAAGGVYFIRLDTPGKRLVQRVLFLR